MTTGGVYLVPRDMERPDDGALLSVEPSLPPVQAASRGWGGDYKHARMDLNNWLQVCYGSTKYLTWDVGHVGPVDAGYWVAIAYCTHFRTNNFRYVGLIFLSLPNSRRY
jgi:hypothetical protein